VVAVSWAQTWSWGPITNAGDLQTHYFRIPFAEAPHIVGSAYLSEVSTGGKNGVAGVAVAAFKRFEFLDEEGVVQETELTTISSFVEVDKCVSITIALDLVDATACGGWSFYWLS
jgi:hypothetical protein